LEWQLSPRSMIKGDKIQLERLVSNLISNALKYTGTGGRVEVIVQTRGDRVEFSVEDTGRGIAPEHIPNIFERFFRVPDGNVDPERGLGLGLSFAAWIAKAHGAKINVESTPGVGSRFLVQFPAAGGRAAEEPLVRQEAGLRGGGRLESGHGA